MKRRDFAESILTAALVPLLGTAGQPAGGWWQTVLCSGAAPVADELDAHARALAGAVRASYGSRLSQDDLTVITRQIHNALERAQQMRKVDLANGDEPDFVFTALGEPSS
jgi:hypothetical protein